MKEQTGREVSSTTNVHDFQHRLEALRAMAQEQENEGRSRRAYQNCISAPGRAPWKRWQKQS